MKLLDKKRIKTKKGEHLALNERNMLAKVGAARGEPEEKNTHSPLILLGRFAAVSRLL